MSTLSVYTDVEEALWGENIQDGDNRGTYKYLE